MLRLSPLARSAAHRLALLASASLLAAALLLAGTAVRASAIVTKVAGHGYGVTPITGASATTLSSIAPARRVRAARPYDQAPRGGSRLEYLGGPVMHASNTHVVYWDPEKEFTATTTGIVERFFTDVERESGQASNVFAVDAQYADSAGNAAYRSTFAGALTDAHAFPVSGCVAPTSFDPGPYAHCLTDVQLQAELSSFIAREGLPAGPAQLYFLLLPHRVATCFASVGEECSSNEFCAYHSYIDPGSVGEIIYATIPFSLLDSGETGGLVHAKACQADLNSEIQTPNGDTAGTNASTRYADVALKYVSHEFSEAVTDPLVGTATAWVDEHELENGDKCNAVPYGPGEAGAPGFDVSAFTPTLAGGLASAGTLFNQSIGGDRFYLQSEWDNAAGACLMEPLPLGAPAFTASPAEGLVGSPVTFSGSASDPYRNLALTWSFGDGTTGSGSSPAHAYAAAGSYTVTMSATDTFTGSSAAPVSQSLVVAAPPVPAPIAAPVAALAAAPRAQPQAAASSTFASRASFNSRNGAIALTVTVTDPGTLSWLSTFPNGRFGVFTASAARCGSGQLRLRGRCRPARIAFARGRAAVTADTHVVTVILKPSRSGLKALRAALAHSTGVPVTVALTFQSSRGGSAVTHVRQIVVRLRRH